MLSSSDITPILGKEFPICQGTHSPRYGKEFPMAPHREKLLPRHILQRSLRALMEAHKVTGPEIAAKAKIDRKSVNNMLNARNDPRPDKVNAVADAFGYDVSQLFSPHFRPDKNGGKVHKLVNLFEASNEDGKESILRIAEMAANHRRP